jgi:hypothetical protein
MPQSRLYQSRTIQCVRGCVAIHLCTCTNVCSQFVIAGTAGVDDIEVGVAAAAPRRLLWAEEKQRPDFRLELGSGDGAPSYIICRSRLRPATFLAPIPLNEQKNTGAKGYMIPSPLVGPLVGEGEGKRNGPITSG